jgi:glycosyltransferase involved in cell wall biosynthesis
VWFQVDHVIAVSEAVRDVLVANGVAVERISVVRDGVDPEEVRADALVPFDIRGRLGLAPDTPTAVNVAALVDHKDHRTLIRAALTAAQSNLHWVVAGDGELRPSLEREIAQLGLQDRVHFVGYVPHVAALIREATVFVMSSKSEGLGSAVLEALALEKPVIATCAGGLAEILPADALVPCNDPEALARAVVRAIDHPSPGVLPPDCTAAAMAAGVRAVYTDLHERALRTFERVGIRQSASMTRRSRTTRSQL